MRNQLYFFYHLDHQHTLPLSGTAPPQQQHALCSNKVQCQRTLFLDKVQCQHTFYSNKVQYQHTIHLSKVRQYRLHFSKWLTQSCIDKCISPWISGATNAHQAFNLLASTYKGKKQVKTVRLQTLRLQFESLKMKETETID